MPRLNVNIDHVATVRQARGGTEPDPVTAALIAELAGAGGIVAHLREDRRHAQERDLEILRRVLKSKLNMEMAPTQEMYDIALMIKPDMVTLVPEKRAELTTEGGLDVSKNLDFLTEYLNGLKKAGIFTSLFIDPDRTQITNAVKTGTDMVEIHTGSYAESFSGDHEQEELKKIKTAVTTSLNLGVRVAAGHGLNYLNVSKIAEIEGIEELNIGHSIISRAVIVGMDTAVRDMLYHCGE